MPWAPQRLARVTGTGLVLAVLMSCGDDPASPGDRVPSDETETAAPEGAERALREGKYDAFFSACGTCEPGSVPDYLLVLGRGIRGTVEIVGAAETGAALRLIELRDAGSEGDVLGLFADLSIPLTWNDTDAGFRGAVDYGAAAVFMPVLRRDGDELECEFEVFHKKHDVAPTACAVRRPSDD